MAGGRPAAQPGVMRALPSVDRVLRWEEVAALLASGPRWAVVEAVRTTLAHARRTLRDASGDDGRVPHRAALVEGVAREFEALTTPSLRGLLNATGVVVHTNLGRAPLAPEAVFAMAEVCGGYSTLEYDLEAGGRGSRQVHTEALLRRLTAAEAAIVVNNNAAAVLLTMAALAAGGEVVVSRGELVEIGGSFRIPEVLAAGGARLVEVGTTNRTRLDDYRRAVTPATRLLLKVHPSNFALVGFTEETPAAALAALGKELGVPVVWDLGSGCLVDLAAVAPALAAHAASEPTPAAALEAGVDLVTFSGDKLLGGPQAGVVAGRAHLVDRLRRHPLMRALRPGKATLAALEATLRLYLDGDPASRVPVVRMLAEPVESILRRARSLARAIRRLDAARLLHVEVVREEGAVVGGGALPAARLPTAVVRLVPNGPGGRAAHGPRDAGAPGGDGGVPADGGRDGSGGGGEGRLARALRAGHPPVVGRVAGGALVLDLRTVPEPAIPVLARRVVEAAGRVVPADS